MHQSIDQSVRSITISLNAIDDWDCANQSLSQSIDLSISQSTHQPINQSYLHLVLALALGTCTCTCTWHLHLALALGTCTWYLHLVLGTCTWYLHLVLALALGTCTWYLHLHLILALGTCTAHTCTCTCTCTSYCTWGPLQKILYSHSLCFAPFSLFAFFSSMVCTFCSDFFPLALALHIALGDLCRKYSSRIPPKTPHFLALS